MQNDSFVDVFGCWSVKVERVSVTRPLNYSGSLFVGFEVFVHALAVVLDPI